MNQGLNYIQAINPKVVLPFAGTYVLGGKFSKLQDYRGVPEIEEAAKYFQENLKPSTKVILLNSYEYFDLNTFIESKTYIPQDLDEKKRYLGEILAFKKYDYEEDPIPESTDLVPLMEIAYERLEAKRKEINFFSSTVVLINLFENGWFLINMDGSGAKIISQNEKNSIEKFVAYTLDLKLLKRLLLGPKYAHWNNAEIGSHISFERNPNIFERGLFYSMCYFHV